MHPVHASSATFLPPPSSTHKSISTVSPPQATHGSHCTPNAPASFVLTPDINPKPQVSPAQATLLNNRGAQQPRLLRRHCLQLMAQRAASDSLPDATYNS